MTMLAPKEGEHPVVTGVFIVIPLVGITTYLLLPWDFGFVNQFEPVLRFIYLLVFFETSYDLFPRAEVFDPIIDSNGIS